MVSEDAHEEGPAAVVAEPTVRSEQQHGVFDKSALLRKLGARKAAWRPEVTFDVDRLIDSGALPAAGIDLVVEDDEIQENDGDMPSSGASSEQGGPVDKDAGDSSVATDALEEEDASEPTEDGSAQGTQGMESPSQCEATNTDSVAGTTVRAADSQAQLSSEAANLHISHSHASEEAAACEGPHTDGIAQEPAQETAGMRSPCSLPHVSAASKHTEKSGNAADAQVAMDMAKGDAAPPADEDCPAQGQGSMGDHVEQGLGTGGSGADIEQQGGGESAEDEDEGTEELAGAHEDEDEEDDADEEEEEDRADELDDEQAGEEGAVVEGESQEGGEQEDDEEGLGDDLEEEYDEDDEEAALLAAIQRERKMQVQLKDHSAAPVPFCDGEAEQSEDEAVSSDEDMDDDGAAMSVEEITEMMKELREKGTGEEELAAAHAKWLEEQDSHMLKRLVRDVKRGFGKGRKRVQDDGDDWDQEDARERRKQVVGDHGLAAALADVSQLTTAQMMRQYKRKLATIGGEDGAPATPVRRTRAAPPRPAVFHADENEDSNLPEIPDTDSPGVKGVGRKKKETSRDANSRSKGPTLLAGRKKNVTQTVKAHSAGFLPCMLGLQDDAAARNNSSHL